MGLGSALSTAVSGLNVNQNALDVIGNNLANANTTAFKAFRPEFVSNFYNTLSVGSQPGELTAGINPRQLGLGSNIGAISNDFRPAAPTQTGLPSDLFIQGTGFFVVQNGFQQYYTRDGAFRLDSLNTLTNSQGLRVQGYAVDDAFNLQTGVLSDLRIPLGILRTAEATQNAFLEGTLNSAGDVATQPAVRSTLAGAIATTGATALNTINVGTPPRPLIDNGTGSFAGPVTVTYTPKKGGRFLPPATFTLQPTDTVNTLMTNVINSLGINTATGQVPAPGFTVGPNDISVRGNLGEDNDFEIRSTDFRVIGLGTDGAYGTGDDTTGSIAPEFNFDNLVQSANGESAVSTITAYDSLGEKVSIQVTAYLQAVADDQTTFRLLFESRDNDNLGGSTVLPPNAQGPNGVIGTTTLRFDSLGKMIDPPNLTVPISVNRSNLAAGDLSFDLDLSRVSALASANSQLVVVSQDGSPPGTLVSFGVSETGVINGAFDNGVTRSLGQVALARFSNPQGLVTQENNLYSVGPNSGLPFVTDPGNGVGTILSGSLEQSNVDVAVSFIQLLTYSTAFSANSRVIATTQDLFQTLLNLPRT